MPLWLVGMMGSGKTAVGRRLAERVGEGFADTDHLIEEETGMTISQIWEVEGEAGFRHRERMAVASLAGQARLVVASGGGAVIDPANVLRMRSSGRVIWLDARPSTLADRVGSTGDRPLLADSELIPRLLELLNQRRLLYLAAAHFRVSTDSRTIDEVADEVEAIWNES